MPCLQRPEHMPIHKPALPNPDKIAREPNGRKKTQAPKTHSRILSPSPSELAVSYQSPSDS
ncbi:hypothetical protein ASPVEDRAFT_48029 [Aspergillus versicolor CBS 583.65]|uniref:Uncharacterized protein n=1 Tax=Aspergillus versicolor CBS 583.65 TaxID=1036611 RepID=A0A1L9Q548_ASPVE|nr:uncharacterized protein ASPVEDRAFT_48029 [Aspergillus versicolor CBS 583.65]OJJ08900.1 hypothetical protein ASPVEDRAFT_48029 [Aspergillus versicolor CBS 583.65]